MTNLMASHLAQLLSDSDLEELEEVVARWLKDAPSDATRREYCKLGTHLLQLKRELSSLPEQPRREDLEAAISMMMGFAFQRTVPVG